MRDDREFEHLLVETLAVPAPELRPGFHAAVMRRVSPRRASRGAIAALTLYAVAGAIVCVWLLADLPPVLVGSFITVSAAAAGVAGAYATRLACVRS